MVKVRFTEKEMCFHSTDGKKQYSILCIEHPEVFGHPRHLMVDFERARSLLNHALRNVSGIIPLAPKVEIWIERHVEGGLTDVDRRTLKDFFLHSGARDVQIRGVG